MNIGDGVNHTDYVVSFTKIYRRSPVRDFSPTFMPGKCIRKWKAVCLLLPKLSVRGRKAKLHVALISTDAKYEVNMHDFFYLFISSLDTYITHEEHTPQSRLLY